ncbi:MAG TPA: DUF2062 domain-containing protein [Burkholderiaceae bacterium]|nr:DUF2062 domain-containing protein [Burkholderiaceae bacterium]
MPRKFFRKVMPNVDKVREVKALSMFGDALFHPALWHLNRRSAAGGVAVGLFCGLIPGPLQMLGAAIVCVFVRVNLPLALVTTLYTNPVTIVPLYLIAYEIGEFTLGSGGFAKPPALPEWQWTHMIESMEAIGHWMMSLGAPLALGLLLLASMLAALGYLTVRGIWSIYLRRAWRARRHRSRAA